jgi:hypothetical protein
LADDLFLVEDVVQRQTSKEQLNEREGMFDDAQAMTNDRES